MQAGWSAPPTEAEIRDRNDRISWQNQFPEAIKVGAAKYNERRRPVYKIKDSLYFGDDEPISMDSKRHLAAGEIAAKVKSGSGWRVRVFRPAVLTKHQSERLRKPQEAAT